MTTTLKNFLSQLYWENGLTSKPVFAGYYGYIGADGQPVRVKYSSVDDLGFMANSELVDIEFATEIPPEVETEVAPTEDITEQLTVILPNDSVELANKESISVDAAKFVNDLLRTRIYFDRT